MCISRLPERKYGKMGNIRESARKYTLKVWTQMLFGIYGNRWIKDQPEFKKYINEYWTRPSIDERPKNVEKVEGGCYW